MNLLMILSPEEFLTAVSNGFNKSRGQILLFALIIIISISALILISFILKKNADKIFNNRLNQKYKNLLLIFDINNKEKKIVEKLSSFLFDNKKKSLILTNPNIFHNTLNKLREKENINGLILHSLEKKLGIHNVSVNSTLKSTHDITNGTNVSIFFGPNNKITGNILESEKYLKIIVYRENLNINKGAKTVILTYNNTGKYAFFTKLIEYKDDIMCFYHSSKFKIFQRREFYRKIELSPVLVQRKKIDDSPKKTSILNLSGGGACIDNSKIGYKIGDIFKLYFQKNQKNNLIINAEVIRTSKKQSKIHVKFKKLIPVLQDQIIGLVNT